MFRMEISEYDQIIQLFKGVGNKTGSFDYLEHPVPQLRGEISKQESYLSKGDLFGGLRHNASLVLSRSIQFLHLDQAGYDYFVGHLVHINSSRFLRSQIEMERIFPLTKYLSFKPVCFRKRFIHYLILLLHSSVVIPMIVINRHQRPFRITKGQATKEQYQGKREILRQFDQIVF